MRTTWKQKFLTIPPDAATFFPVPKSKGEISYLLERNDGNRYPISSNEDNP